MIKSLRAAVLSWVAAAVTVAAGPSPVNYTQTNVLQNVAIQLTLYQQGATNASGTKVADQVTSYTTKNLIADLGTVTSQQFGSGAKLVLCSVYSNITITTSAAVYSNYFSTNLALTTNQTLDVGGLALFYGINGDSGRLTISDGVVTPANPELPPANITSDVVSVVGNPGETVTINTNAQYITTITPSTNGTGNSEDVTNVVIVTQFQSSPATTANILTNISNSIDILYGGAANALYPVTNYLSFSTSNSAQIVVESGTRLNTTNAANLSSQSGFSIQGLIINYFMPTGPTNLTLTLQGFVKQALKIDTLYSHGTNKVVEDVFGASATWNAFGAGFAGGAFTTNQTSAPILGGYLTNANPVVAEGSVNISFLKNLPQ